jgi:hypothetical protein
MLKVWIHGQRQNRCRALFCHGKIAFFVAQRRISPLQVKGYGVVDLGGDIGLLEPSLDPVPILDSDHIEVIDAGGLRRTVRQDNGV